MEFEGTYHFECNLSPRGDLYGLIHLGKGPLVQSFNDMQVANRGHPLVQLVLRCLQMRVDGVARRLLLMWGRWVLGFGLS